MSKKIYCILIQYKEPVQTESTVREFNVLFRTFKEPVILQNCVKIRNNGKTITYFKENIAWIEQWTE